MGVPKKQLDAAIEYIRQTPVVRDVFISGGDGLLINDHDFGIYFKKSACN